MQAAFGQRTGCDNTHLFAFLRNMSISRDQDAPIDLNPDDWIGFHKRRDATRLRNALSTVQAAKDQAVKDQPFYDENKTKELDTLTELLRLLRSRDRALRRAWGKLKLWIYDRGISEKPIGREHWGKNHHESRELFPT